MKRDMDLLREMMLEIEAMADKQPTTFSKTIKDRFTYEEIEFHIALLNDRSLIRAESTTYFDGQVGWEINRLTWEGCEFLDAARDQSRWSRAKNIAGEKAGGITFDVLTSLLTQLMRQAVGL